MKPAMIPSPSKAMIRLATPPNVHTVNTGKNQLVNYSNRSLYSVAEKVVLIKSILCQQSDSPAHQPKFATNIILARNMQTVYIPWIPVSTDLPSDILCSLALAQWPYMIEAITCPFTSAIIRIHTYSQRHVRYIHAKLFKNRCLLMIIRQTFIDWNAITKIRLPIDLFN